MEKVLTVINQLEQEGIIGRYAIGEAVAATRYIEPILIQFFELDARDLKILEDIVSRHGLTSKWERFQRRFSNESK